MCSGLSPTTSSSSLTFARRSSLSPTPCAMSGSAMIEATVIRGFNDAYGSWKTIWTSRRSFRSVSRCAVPTSMTSSPSPVWNSTSPEVGSIRRSRHRAVVDLPEPDSPTRPNVSPRRTSKEMFETACTAPICFLKNTPRRIGNSFTRFLTRMSTSCEDSAGLSDVGVVVSVTTRPPGERCASGRAPWPGGRLPPGSPAPTLPAAAAPEHRRRWRSHTGAGTDTPPSDR